MQSNKSLAVWASQTYSQTGGVNNWSQYQLSLTGTSSKFNVNAAGSSSTTLSLYDARNRYGNILVAGDTVLLSTNGSTFTSGTLGAQTSTVAPYTATTSNFVSRAVAGGSYPNYFVKPDGTKMWWGGSSGGIVYEYDIATPYDMSTATRTVRTFTCPYGNAVAFCFSVDGSTIYYCNSGTVYSHALTTAWDITTISAYANGTCTYTTPATSYWSGSFSTSIRFSPDGTKMLIQNGHSNYGNSFQNWALFTLNVPWVLNSLASPTTTNYTSYLSQNGGNTYTQTGASEFSPDGMTLFVYSGVYGSPSCSPTNYALDIFTFSSPWSLTTASKARTYLGYYTFGSTQGQVFLAGTFNATGTQISTISNVNYYQNIVCDLWTKYNYNISGYSLGATPTNAYAAAPTVKVDAETTSARVNLFDYQVYMASSSTTQAVVYKPSAGYIAAGDTLSLNGTTTVTTSAVTEGTTGAVAAVPIYTAANRSYAGKSFGVQTSGNIGSLRMSTDGTVLIIMANTTGTYGTGLYSYSLSTPFDISTATFSTFLSTTSNGLALGCFDISPDGTRLIMGSNYVTGAGNPQGAGYVYEYILSQPWNIATSYYNGGYWYLASSTNNPRGIKFNANGTQVILSYSSASIVITYQNCGTPYRIATCPTGVGTTWVAGAAANPTGILQTPDGLNILTFNGGSAGAFATSNTLGTAYNMATATQTNSVTTATNVWAWPTGTVASGSSILCGDFSADGTKFYACSSTSPSIVWQFNVMVIPQTSYTCTFPTQGSAPTSVIVPDRGVAQTITTTLSGGNMIFASSAVGTNARGIGMKITSPKTNTTITNATLSMWRS